MGRGGGGGHGGYQPGVYMSLKAFFLVHLCYNLIIDVTHFTLKHFAV